MKIPAHRITRFIILAFNLFAGSVNLFFGLMGFGWPSLSLVVAGAMFGIASTDIMWLYFGSKVIPISPKVREQYDRELEAQMAKNAFRLVDQVEREIDRRGLRGFVEEVKARAGHPAGTKH